MAWIQQQQRTDGGLTARVIWRLGGGRDAVRMVEAGGQRWPDGWVKGEGFVPPPDVADPLTPPPCFDEIGEESDRSSRLRYLGQLKVLAGTPVRGSFVFAGPVTVISRG